MGPANNVRMKLVGLNLSEMSLIKIRVNKVDDEYKSEIRYVVI